MKTPIPVARDADEDAAPVLDPDEDEVEADEDADAVEDDAEEESDIALDEKLAD
jgi:hypothetical protein